MSGPRWLGGRLGESRPGHVRAHAQARPVAGLDLASMRALAYAASLRQPVLALHLSPTEEEAERFTGTGKPGAITFRWRCSSRPTARSSHPWSITFGHCTASGPT